MPHLYRLGAGRSRGGHYIKCNADEISSSGLKAGGVLEHVDSNEGLKGPLGLTCSQRGRIALNDLRFNVPELYNTLIRFQFNVLYWHYK